MIRSRFCIIYFSLSKCPGTGWTDDRFVFELDEPGDKLPGQTRKFVAYFSEVMTLDVQASGAYFAPAAGGQFSGTMQVSIPY